MKHRWLSCALLVLACGPARTAEEPPSVPVAQPVCREVTDYEAFTGRLEPVLSVEVRARVTGYLLETPFKEGGEVKKGDLLFAIDPRPYQAELDKAQALLAASEARLKRAEGDFQRAKALLNDKAITPGELDKITAEREEAQAGIRVAKAVLDFAKLNLEFTRVTSPIDGCIGRRLLDPGNLVKADETVLAKIVSEDPMYVYFDLDERTLLRIRRANKMPPVLLGLVGEEGYPHRGTIDFVNNQVNPTTGSISVRAVLPNPRPRLLSPGMSVRVRLAVSEPHKVLLVTDRAVLTKLGLIKYVIVVNDKGVVEHRHVTNGALQEDGLRVIAEGLKADEWVAVGGPKGLWPGVTVRPNKVSMPAKKPPADEGKKQP
jgi:multidrug efflux system membrane fusion protein